MGRCHRSLVELLEFFDVPSFPVLEKFLQVASVFPRGRHHCTVVVTGHRKSVLPDQIVDVHLFRSS